MTDKTHEGLPVHGYKPQSDEKVALVNEFKQDEERLLRKIQALMAAFTYLDANGDDREPPKVGEWFDGRTRPTYDPRWLAVARTHFQEGFMALNRAVFQPERIRLPEDDEDAS